MLSLRAVSINNLGAGVVLSNKAVANKVLGYIIRQSSGQKIKTVSMQYFLQFRDECIAAKDTREYLDPKKSFSQEAIWRTMQRRNSFFAAFNHSRFGSMAFELRKNMPQSGQFFIGFNGQDDIGILVEEIASEFILQQAMEQGGVRLTTFDRCETMDNVNISDLMGVLPNMDKVALKSANKVSAGLLMNKSGVVAEVEEGEIEVSLRLDEPVKGWEDDSVLINPSRPDNDGSYMTGFLEAASGGVKALAANVLERLWRMEIPYLQIYFDIRKRDRSLIHLPEEVAMVSRIANDIAKAYQPWLFSAQ